LLITAVKGIDIIYDTLGQDILTLEP
jgi:hypothetical protein